MSLVRVYMELYKTCRKSAEGMQKPVFVAFSNAEYICLFLCTESLREKHSWTLFFQVHIHTTKQCSSSDQSETSLHYYMHSSLFQLLARIARSPSLPQTSIVELIWSSKFIRCKYYNLYLRNLLLGILVHRGWFFFDFRTGVLSGYFVSFCFSETQFGRTSLL